jgi:hypothetical protein
LEWLSLQDGALLVLIIGSWDGKLTDVFWFEVALLQSSSQSHKGKKLTKIIYLRMDQIAAIMKKL